MQQIFQMIILVTGTCFSTQTTLALFISMKIEGFQGDYDVVISPSMWIIRAHRAIRVVRVFSIRKVSRIIRYLYDIKINSASIAIELIRILLYQPIDSSAS
jgi:hypothetical protein